MGFYIGIDLGTTNSTVSVIQTQDTYDSPLETLETCGIEQLKRVGEHINDECLPSALYFDVDNKRVYTGQFAKTTYASGDHPLQTALSIKTRMGGDSRLTIPSLSGTGNFQTFDMKECASFFIRTIVETLKKNYPEQGKHLTDECVVTVPAAFNDDERVATKNAVLLGGFKNCIILDEPTAALLSYINSKTDEDDEDEDDVTYKLVYDIGGGTLDVSIAKISLTDEADYLVDIVGLSERMNLGGDNFDRLLGAYFLQEFERTNQPLDKYSEEDQGRIIARIVSNAEYYKKELSRKIIECGDNSRKLKRVNVKVAFELINGMYVTGIELNKQIFEDLFYRYTSPNETKFGLLAPIKMALRRSGLKKEDIGEVILTGGMANFYAVRETLEKFFGDIPINMVDDTRTAVSRGAALYHWGLDEDNVSEDATKISSLSNKLASNIYVRNAAGEFELLIPADLSRTSGIYHYKIIDDNVAYFPFYLYSGAESDGNEDMTSTYTQLTGRMIRAKPEYTKGYEIPIEWSIDENKVITVKIQDEKTPDDKTLKLSRLLTSADVAKSFVNSYTIN